MDPETYISLATQIDEAAAFIRKAQKALGRTLSVGERSDLLLDNMPDLKDSDESHHLVYLVGGTA
jgi:hypothetical protein